MNVIKSVYNFIIMLIKYNLVYFVIIDCKIRMHQKNLPKMREALTLAAGPGGPIRPGSPRGPTGPGGPGSPCKVFVI